MHVLIAAAAAGGGGLAVGLMKDEDGENFNLAKLGVALFGLLSCSLESAMGEPSLPGTLCVVSRGETSCRNSDGSGR